MKYLGYFYPDQCPLTDIDREIMTKLAHNIGSGYYGIHQTEQA